MERQEHIRCGVQGWEADPWDASREVAEAQVAGFTTRAAKFIEWSSVRASGPTVFGISAQRLLGADVEFHAVQDGEELLLMQSAWHGYPDPPEWRLVSRSGGADDLAWVSWGYFAHVPAAWKLPV